MPENSVDLYSSSTWRGVKSESRLRELAQKYSLWLLKYKLVKSQVKRDKTRSTRTRSNQQYLIKTYM